MHARVEASRFLPPSSGGGHQPTADDWRIRTLVIIPPPVLGLLGCQATAPPGPQRWNMSKPGDIEIYWVDSGVLYYVYFFVGTCRGLIKLSVGIEIDPALADEAPVGDFIPSVNVQGTDHWDDKSPRLLLVPSWKNTPNDGCERWP